jgi:ferredoxin
VASDEGPVVYNPTKCMGCRYCMMACPFSIPRYDWELSVPYVKKCTMCKERQERGEQPGCTEACPKEATIFGDRDELLAEAHRRIEAEPDRYVGKVFGETEVGGTCVLYISDIDLEFLQVGHDVGARPMPDRTHMAMTAVPFVFVGMGALMGGLHWIIGRRNELAAGERADREQPEENEEDGSEGEGDEGKEVES